MKKLLVFSTLIFAITSCRSQDISQSKVPSVVVNSVTTQYPGLAKIDWDKSKNDYVAEFNLNDSTEVELKLDASGQLLLSKKELTLQQAPAPFITAVQQAFPNHKIDDVEEIKKGSAVYYQVELEGKGKDLKKVFTAEGKETKDVAYWD